MENTEQNNRKYTSEDLKRLQSLTLDEKIQLSKARIIEFAEKMDNKIYVSFSGGKDSTVLLHLVRSVYSDAPAVFVDTGLEYPELREFALNTENVIRLKPEMNFKKVLQTYGYPVISKEVSKRVAEYRNAIKKGNLINCAAYKEFNGLATKGDGGKSFYNKEKWKFLVDADFLISHKCCDVMKKKPAHKFEKETGLHPIIGTLAEESMLRKKNWLINGCNVFLPNKSSSTPLSFWTTNDILEYIKRYDLKYASVYGDIVQDQNGNYRTTGCDRTGCVYCALGLAQEREPNRFQQLKITHPKLWDYCMRPFEEGGLNMRHVLEYIGIKYE